uniref:TPM domain-containing protein n=1 Tax=Caenorhabditis japonica TaxID=281687 RepID=A0A8R1I901_CAEJA
MDPLLILFPFLLLPAVLTQFTSQTYPDPRLDPFSCRLALPSQICDPSAIVSDEERTRLVQRVGQLHALTAGIKNTSPSCALMPDRNLEIIVAIIDKIGSVPGVPVDIEKFANNLKRRYQNFQDVGMCDTTVLIVNSRQDRQVFTVAGRDAKISKDTLKSAFERNIGHFKTGRYALGLEGMIEVIVAAYSNAHIVQVPSPEIFRPTEFVPSSPVSAVESQPFRAAGIPNSVQPSKRPFAAINTIQENIDEDDKVWVSILQQAMARCGQNDADLPKHVRAVVEEAMNISLKLISDSRYNKIEEETEQNKEVLGSRQKAWDTATADFIRPLSQKYRHTIQSGATQTCPVSASSLRKRKHF